MSITFQSDNGTEGVNLSNVNALAALGHMGAEPDYWGEMSADEFAAGALNLMVLDDDGDADVAVADNYTDCGHRPGYWRDVANRFMAVADGATEVWWG
jgi:hypothetical protein